MKILSSGVLRTEDILNTVMCFNGSFGGDIKLLPLSDNRAFILNLYSLVDIELSKYPVITECLNSRMKQELSRLKLNELKWFMKRLFVL